MELLSPARITSLEGKAIRVIIHHDKRRTEELALPAIYPFETLYTLKQRITLSKPDDKSFLPNYLFVAQDTGGANYSTLEFYWPFSKTLKDPFDKPGVADDRIYEDGEIKGDVFPFILSGVTVEDALQFSAAGDAARVIHVWTAASILKAAGFGPRTMLTEEAFHGFFTLYFPYFKTADELMLTFAKEDAADKAVLETAQQFRKEVDARLNKIEAGLTSAALAKAPTMRLRELRYLRYELPKLDAIADGTLELKFYEMNPSHTIPFIRFFSRRDTSLPLIKLATSATGTPVIKDPKVLDLFMADIPDTEKSAVLVLKAPVVNSQAPLGTCWTMSIFETGVAHLKVGAPRKDAPLTQVAVEAAISALPEFLSQTPWAEKKERTLVDLTAVYDFKSPLSEKPNKGELRGRLDAFVSFFSEEPLPPKSKAAMMLRYRAVSNYDATTNPIMNHITNIFLRDTKASVEEIPEEAYVASLVQTFGMPPLEASRALNKWIESQFEYVLQNKESALQAANLGAAVGLTTNNHPYYTFYLANVQSLKSLQRILSLLSVFSSLPASALRVGPVAKEAVIRKVESDTPESSPESIESAASDESEAIPVFGMQQFDGFDDDEPDAFEVAAPAGSKGPAAKGPAGASPEPPAPPPPHLEIGEVEAPDVLREDEKVEPIKSGWFLDNLKRADPGLFGGHGAKARGDSYSVKCQKTGYRQPFVLTAENYVRVRKLYRKLNEATGEYEDDVFWVEAPLELRELQCATIANKTDTQRISHGMKLLKIKDRKSALEPIADMEIEALTMGFGLKGDKSVTGVSLEDDAAKIRTDTPKQKEIRALMRAQKRKPLWTIMRAGSISERPNYYWCGLYWCVRDEMPLIPDEFAGDKLRNGKPKLPNSCPFCGGTLITDLTDPEVGETVYERKKTSKGVSRVAQYIGLLKEVSIPDGYALPCCFVDADDLAVPAAAKPMPPPHPDVRFDGESPANDISPESKESAADDRGAPALPDDDNRFRPFATKQVKAEGAKEKGRAMNQWYIPNQNIIGRSAKEWYAMQYGEVGVPPPSVNRLLGQDPNVFLTENKGILGQGINSYLQSPGHAFVRYSLADTGILGLIGFARYAIYALDEDGDSEGLRIRTPEDLYNMIFDGKKTGDYVRAFTQANYGTLVHEFADESIEIVDSKFTDWCKEVGEIHCTDDDQRDYSKNYYRAWLNFEKYMDPDHDHHKDLRLFEGLFATPGLFTKSGFLLVRIVVPKNPAEAARIVCPEFGASAAAQQTRPPLLFVVENEETGAYDPLVLYNSNAEGEKQLIGAIKEDKPDFDALPEKVKSALSAFITQFYGPFNGCARTSALIHPWMGSKETTSIPTVSEFIQALEKPPKKADDETPEEKKTLKHIKFHAFLRDRSNRLVGAIIKSAIKHVHGKPELAYVPLLDDGTVYPGYSSLRGEKALPKPKLEVLLDLLIGQEIPPSAAQLSGDDMFPAFRPVQVVKSGKSYVALDLACGATIPFKPTDGEILHKKFAKKVKEKVITVDPRKDMPWDRDLSLIGPSPSEKETIDATDEELLEEAYQHLRISFSHWLHTDPAGIKTRELIEKLRQKARKRQLPLWDLRKRMDVLIASVVNHSERPWMTTEGTPLKTFLRRDCLQIKKEEECAGGCTWAGDPARCLIHTTETERFVDPARVLVARLVDELIRTFGAAEEVLKQKVPYLKPVAKDALVKSDESLMFSAEGRGGESLFKRLGYYDRQPTSYTRGLTYPEEVDMDVEGAAAPLPPLPAEWNDRLAIADFGAEHARDAQKRFELAVESIAGKSIAEITAGMGDTPLDGTDESLNKLARLLNINIIATEFDGTSLVPDEWYGEEKAPSADEDPLFVVLDHNGVPLLRVKTLAFTIPKGKLPKSLKKWIRDTPAVKYTA